MMTSVINWVIVLELLFQGMTVNSVLDEMALRISVGLARKSVTNPAKWACKYRKMSKPFPGNWSFKYHPWLEEMHNSKAEMNIGRKAAQLGFTEWAMNLTFFKIDIEGRDVLYVLPNKTPDATDFTAGRFNPALELSPHLAMLFTNVDNVGHKRAGSNNLYVRGSQSRAGLKSVPIGFIVLDEVDEMNQDNVPLALQRSSGQMDYQALLISTPTREGIGIDGYYQNSTQEHFFFRCPGCNRYIELTYPESLVITAEALDDPRLKDSHIICSKCKKILNHSEKPDWLANNQWVIGKSGFEARGFHVSQLYSYTVQPHEIAIYSILSKTSIPHEVELYNSKLGQPRTPAGSTVTDSDLKKCTKSYKNGELRSNRVVTMGVDVGVRFNHLQITEWFVPDQLISGDLNVESRARVLYAGKHPDFKTLDKFMDIYGINMCVIDAQPERRLAFEFAQRFWGRVKMCFYNHAQQGKLIHESENPEPIITVDRTFYLDMSLGRFKAGTIIIPEDIGTEYWNHIKAPARLYRIPDPQKASRTIRSIIQPQVLAYYVSDRDDHYAHANNYAEIALPLAIASGQSQSISAPI